MPGAIILSNERRQNAATQQTMAIKVIVSATGILICNFFNYFANLTECHKYKPRLLF